MAKLLEDTDFRVNKEISDREIYNGEIFKDEEHLEILFIFLL